MDHMEHYEILKPLGAQEAFAFLARDRRTGVEVTILSIALALGTTNGAKTTSDGPQAPSPPADFDKFFLQYPVHSSAPLDSTPFSFQFRLPEPSENAQRTI